MKDDKPIKTDKRNWDIVPLSFFGPVVDVFDYASVKYRRCSWQHCAPEDLQKKYLAAGLRHIEAYADGELLDPESGFPHLAHAMANFGILLWHNQNTEQ